MIMMSNENKISIIVPIYNLQEELEHCVASIQAQSYKNIEIILVNDGSKDHSREIMNKLAAMDLRIKTVNKENGGVTSARLAGVRVATGEWIGFVDGDDEIETNMYEFLLKNAIEYQADISHCGYQMCFPDGRIRFFYNTGYLTEQDRITALKELMTGTRVEPGLCNKLFHKSLFQSLLQTNILDTSIKINEDLLMNFHLFNTARKAVYEDKCPYHYIVRYSSASRQNLNEFKIYDPIKVKRQILDFAPQELKMTAEAAYLSTCVNVYNSLVCSKGSEFKLDKRKVRQLILEKKEWVCLLNRKIRFLSKVIIYASIIYTPMYRIYEMFFQKKKYS
jgi:glycosyltransferase involved in cell wall biosynthesis